MRIILCITIILLINHSLFADIIVMKDGKKLKGLVVDEYADRVTLSTVDGEKDILRKDIERIEYDTPEQNFMQLGRLYEEKGWYGKASFYYKKAMDINPEYKEAREAYLASHAKMWREEERSAKKELERQNIALSWWKNRYKKDRPETRDKLSLLKETLGFSLIEKDGIFTITEVRSGSSADKAGIQRGDLLVGIWGRLIKYSKLIDVLDELLGPKYSEVRVLIEREVVVPLGDIKDDAIYKNLGINLGFEYDGLMVRELREDSVADLAGLKKGDYIIAIDKNITRYLPIDSIISIINSTREEKIVFNIRRKVNLRRE